MATLDTTVGGLASLIVILWVILTITTILRFFARRKQGVSNGVDDWLAIPAWIGYTAWSAVGLYAIANHTLGYETPKDPAEAERLLTKLSAAVWPGELLMIIGLGCTRLSALFFYRRIFNTRGHTEPFMIVTWSLAGIVILWAIGYLMLTIFQCGSHVSSIWLAPRTCPAVTYPFIESWSISSFMLDVLVCALPLPKIWSLHASLKRKFSICAVFLFALAGLGASCARMVIFIKLIQEGPVAAGRDVLITNTRLIYYMTAETGLCAIAITLPSLWYFHSGIKPEKILRSIRSFTSLRSQKTSFEETTEDVEKNIEC